MHKFYYYTNCINSTAKLIDEMIDRSIEITYKTFISKVDINELKKLFPFYDQRSDQGLTLKNDWSVSYHRSKYKGECCYYICHSAIEYIFKELT